MHAITDTLFRVFERAADHMTDEELTAAARLTEGAAHQAARLARLAEGIGVLLDSEATGRGNTGVFQAPEDVSELLYSIAWQCDAIAAASHIGRSAQFELETRRTAAAEATTATTRRAKP